MSLSAGISLLHCHPGMGGCRENLRSRTGSAKADGYSHHPAPQGMQVSNCSMAFGVSDGTAHDGF